MPIQVTSTIRCVPPLNASKAEFAAIYYPKTLRSSVSQCKLSSVLAPGVYSALTQPA